jgi:hypothetical protein
MESVRFPEVGNTIARSAQLMPTLIGQDPQCATARSTRSAPRCLQCGAAGALRTSAISSYRKRDRRLATAVSHRKRRRPALARHRRQRGAKIGSESIDRAPASRQPTQLCASLPVPLEDQLERKLYVERFAGTQPR